MGRSLRGASARGCSFGAVFSGTAASCGRSPAGFVRWLLLVVIFVLGGVLFGVVQYAPSAYYQGKRPVVALAAVCALALLMLAQLGEGLLAVLLVVACEVLIGVLTLHGGKRPARHAEPAAITACTGQPVFLPHPALRRGDGSCRKSCPDARQHGT